MACTFFSLSCILALYCKQIIQSWRQSFFSSHFNSARFVWSFTSLFRKLCQCLSACCLCLRWISQKCRRNQHSLLVGTSQILTGRYFSSSMLTTSGHFPFWQLYLCGSVASLLFRTAALCFFCHKCNVAHATAAYIKVCFWWVSLYRLMEGKCVWSFW